MYFRQSNPSPLTAVLAAFIRWVIARLARLISPRGGAVAGLARAAAGRFNGRFNGRFETPREPLSGAAQPGSGYAGFARAIAWIACAGPWGRDVGAGALVGGATVGRVVTDTPVVSARAGTAGDPQ